MNEKVDGPAERAVREEHVEINIRMSRFEGKSTAAVKNQERVAAGVNRVKGRRLCSIQDEAGEQQKRQRKEQERGGGHDSTKNGPRYHEQCASCHRKSIHPSGFCDVRQQAETIEHALITCRMYFEGGQDKRIEKRRAEGRWTEKHY